MSDLARDLTRDQRPKKKKKPKGMSKGLLIGLIAGGGGVLLVVIILIIVLSSGGGGDGGKKKIAGDDKPKIDPKDYVRPMDEKVAVAKLEEIGKKYHKLTDEKGKPPTGFDDLAKSLDADEKGMIEPAGGWIEMYYNWTPTLLPEGKAKTVVGQEKIPFKGTRLVLFGDASVKVMSDEELAKAPRAPGAPKFWSGPLVTEGGKTRLGKYVRALERFETERVLQILGQEFLAFDLERNRGPKELAELDCRNNARVKESLDPKEGWLVFLWGVGTRGMPAGPAHTVIAYEREPVGGYHYVIYGNARFEQISAEDFAKVTKAK